MLLLALCVLCAPPPTVLRAHPPEATALVAGQPVSALLTAEDVEGVLTAAPCADAPSCTGASVTVPMGKVTLRLWRPGQHQVSGPIQVTGDAKVRAAPTPDRTIERASATTGIALGAALILTSVLVVALDAEHDATLRVALPIATGVGTVSLAAGAIWLRALEAENSPTTAPLELVTP